MNSSEGKDEEDQENQSDVDFIPYDLLEESTKLSEGVFGRECIFKPTNERRALFMLPSKPEEWFKNVLVFAFRLEHENIIRIYGRTCIGGVNGILTEWAEGTSLKKVIHDQSISYTLADILWWNKQSFRALEYVQSFTGKEHQHFRRYFNRILCAENMILDPTRDVLKICSLGLYKDIPDPKDSDEFNYSYYWAPEVWDGEYRYEESDVYPFCAILWECILREEPKVSPEKKATLFYPLFTASFLFNRFIARCTNYFSKTRFPFSEIKTILENMIPAEKGENLQVYEERAISFWDWQTDEFYYCKKLIFFESGVEYSPQIKSSKPLSRYFETEKKKDEAFFHYNLLKDLKVLGNGAFGKVCLAEYDAKKVAVKFLLAMKMGPFLQEYSVLKKLKHENIVKVIGQIEERGFFGIVMEFIDGTSLDKIIHGSSKKYSLGDVLRWNYQAVSALEYMHSLQYLHRDIKPENIMIENSDERTLKIIDLGGARNILIDKSLTLTAMGTELYIAPEIENGDRYNELCDVYSWTITFWECCTAERPQRPPDYRSKVNQICSAKFIEVMEKCSNSDPSNRKCMFIIRKCLGDMLKNRKTFTETDSSFRENHICVWKEQTNELYYLPKTESEKRFNNNLTIAKSLSLKISMDAFKNTEDLDDRKKNVKLIRIADITRFNCSCEAVSTMEDLKSLTSFPEFPDRIMQLQILFHTCFKCRYNSNFRSQYHKKMVYKFSKNGDEKYLENEFLILSKLQHENIIKLLGYAHDDQLNYFGIITHYEQFFKSLDKVLGNRLETRFIIENIGLATAKALEYMHSRNILHCDIRPANIISPLTRLESCVICDFSLARDLQYEHPKEAVGTGIYMAPEVRRDGLLTTKSDVYSWTVMFWEVFIFQDHQRANDLKIEDIRQMGSIDLCETREKYKIANASDKFNEFIQACANTDSDKRWSMTDIVTLLENMIKNQSNSYYLPDFDNIGADVFVKDEICLWTKIEKEVNLTKKDFFYVSPDFRVNLEKEKKLNPQKKSKILKKFRMPEFFGRKNPPPNEADLTFAGLVRAVDQFIQITDEILEKRKNVKVGMHSKTG